MCETNAADQESTISWRRDGQLVSQGVTSSTREETGGVVTVSVWSQRVNWTDRGTYSCEALNSGVTRTSQDLTLVVQVPVSSVILTNITSNNQQVPFNQDSSLVLTCQTSPAYPAATVTWYVRSSSTSSGLSSTQYSVTGTQTSGQIVTVSTITRTMRKTNDQDTFYCRAENINLEAGTQSKTARANVLYGPDANKVNLTRPAVIAERNNVTLTCSTLTPVNPEVDFTWSWEDNTTITSGLGNKQGAARGTWSQTLTVRAVRDSNRQEIRCDVINTQISRSERVVVDLDVSYPPDISLPPIEGPQNTDLTLTCTATGNPSNYKFEDFRQYWGDQLIQRRGGTQTGDRYSLDLPQVSYQDSGVYVGTVGNNVKQPSHKNTTVTVQASPKYTNDVNPTEPIGAKVGQTVKLVQYIYCSPNFTSVSWHFNNTNRTLSTESSSVSSSPVHLDVYGTQVEAAGFKLVYTVNNFQQEHVGLYTVRVCNIVGCAESSLKLIGSGPPETPLHFTALNSTTDSVTLTWTPQYAGGDYTQEFLVEFRVQNTSGEWISRLFPLSQDNSGAGVVDGLDSNTGYVFRIKSVTNRKSGNNQSQLSEEISFSTKEIHRETRKSSSLGIGASIGIGVGICLLLVLALAGVGVAVFKRRHAFFCIEWSNRPQTTERNTDSLGDTATENRPSQTYAQLDMTGDSNSYEELGHVYQNSGIAMEDTDNSPFPPQQYYENLSDPTYINEK